MTLAATADDSCPSHRGKLTVLFLSVASDDTQIPKVSRIEESVLFIYRTPSWIAHCIITLHFNNIKYHFQKQQVMLPTY